MIIVKIKRYTIFIKQDIQGHVMTYKRDTTIDTYCSMIKTCMDLCPYLSRMLWNLERDCIMIQENWFPRDYWKRNQIIVYYNFEGQRL